MLAPRLTRSPAVLLETTQRRLCRTFFLFGCLLPTMALLAWTVWRASPAVQHAGLRRAFQDVALQVEFGKAESPRPGVRRLQDLRVLNPETGRQIARLDRLIVTPTGVRGGNLWVSPEGLNSLATPLAFLLRREMEHQRSACRFDSLQVGDAPPWPRVTAQITDDESGHKLAIASSLAEGTGARLVAWREVRDGDPTTTLRFETPNQPTPWSVLAGMTPLPNNLGAGASFQGVITLSGDGRGGQLSGRLNEVDLAAVAPAGLEVRSHGPTSLDDIELAWKGDHLTRVAATVRAGSGEVDWAVVDSVRSYLGCGMGGRVWLALDAAFKQSAYSPAPLQYDGLAFHFRLDGSGLKIGGMLGKANPALKQWLLEADGEALLFEPNEGVMPIANLLRAVALPGAESLLTCPRASSLARRLPAADAPLRR